LEGEKGGEGERTKIISPTQPLIRGERVILGIKKKKKREKGKKVLLSFLNFSRS